MGRMTLLAVPPLAFRGLRPSPRVVPSSSCPTKMIGATRFCLTCSHIMLDTITVVGETATPPARSAKLPVR